MARPRFTTARILVGIVAAFVAALSLAVVAVGSAPEACRTCHARPAGAMDSTAHEQTNCYSCHAPGFGVVGFKVRELLAMYPRQIIGGDPAGAVLETPRAGCLDCHAEVLEGRSEGERTGIRIDHRSCAPGPTCDGCHSGTAHGDKVRWVREPVMEECVACHRRESASVECDACHEGRIKSERLATGPWQITHGPKWRETHGMGDLESCSTCHPQDYCVRCHKVTVPHDDTFGGKHGEFAIADRQGCESCHRSARFCDACHGVEMPHPAGYLRVHSADARTIENPLCLRCHAREDCALCHERHVHPGNARVSAGLDPPFPGDGGAR